VAIINRLPLGLLSFLDQQTQGKNPQEPQPGLFLTTDATAHYRSQIIVGESIIANVNTASETLIVQSSVASITVPEGFAWEILGVEARLNPNGVIATSFTYTNQIQLRVPFNLGGVGVDIAVAGSRQTFAIADATTMFVSTVWQPGQRLILGKGIRIRAQVAETTAAMIGLVGVQNTLQVARYQYKI
jgi:hypothetical protein